MKRVIYLLGALTLCSCATAYQQIATISSIQKMAPDDGIYRFVEEDVSVTYDFWAENGQVSFVISNNSDSDVYVDLAKSFLVVNGMTFDYYQKRSYSSSSQNTIASSYTYGGSNTFARATGMANAHASSYGDFTDASSFGVEWGTKSTSTTSQRITTISTVNTGIQYEEKEGVWIPANSSRKFSEFSLLETPYRKCGFVRNPWNNEDSTISFNERNTPYAFDNVLTIKIGDKEHRLVHSFYVENFSNYRRKQTYTKQPEENCDGTPTGYTLHIYKYYAANRFYINYSIMPNGASDRLKTGFNWRESISRTRSRQ